MPAKFRTDCPITSALDIVGDKWMLVIIKQMLLEDSQTFKDFTESDEAIATNILSTKLKLLEELQLITKSKLPTNKKMNFYHLTDRGLALAPVVVELAIWSDGNLRGLNPIMRNDEGLTIMKYDREAFIRQVVEGYRKKLASSDFVR